MSIINNLAQKLHIPMFAIVGACICVIGAGVFLAVYLMIRQKRIKEEKQQAVQRMREDALDRVLANPREEKQAEPFEKQRRPFQVEYAKTQNGVPVEKIEKGMYRLTEITELSRRKYMFRSREVVQIGNQFGNITILPQNAGPEQAYCQLFSYRNANYLRSTGKMEVMLRRGGRTTMVSKNGLKLLSGDCFTVGKTSYMIEFI
ncbi:MAG: hypothetical protein Q4F29_00450 [Lachnospiraceae bacterium]|nr:hypothetical protein [Lachnospiraceae bacterium]